MGAWIAASLLAGAAQAGQGEMDLITDARALSARDALQYSLQQYEGETTVVSMYTAEQMNNYIENGEHLSIIRDKDQCQFTPDIEDRARIVAVPAFLYAWADMLITGTCVKKDVPLGLEYLHKAVDQGYAPSLVRMAEYYEKGFYVSRDLRRSEIFMRTAAALGSINGRIGWVDMLLRGYGSPALYEEAYSWLYHARFTDDYRNKKREYLIHELSQRMPPNVLVRAEAYEYDM
ncbi:MAG: flagellar protein MotX [Succinivibrionaceae bacterium]|nr:flagellar protein MotX [Succinivibrionaceae bacterium]